MTTKTILKVNNIETTYENIGAYLGIKPASAHARIKRLRKVAGKDIKLTWELLERGSRNFVYRKKLPEKFECRNELRKQLLDRGIGFQELAKKIKTSRQHVDRVLGCVSDKNRYALTPEFVTRVCKVLKLDKLDTAYMHELGARENGWRF